MKYIQSLNRKLVALGRFMAKLVEQSPPFFQVLKTHIGKSNITWTSKAKEGFCKVETTSQISVDVDKTDSK